MTHTDEHGRKYFLKAAPEDRVLPMGTVRRDAVAVVI
jgi:hypothetical protein